RAGCGAAALRCECRSAGGRRGVAYRSAAGRPGAGYPRYPHSRGGECHRNPGARGPRPASHGGQRTPAARTPRRRARRPAVGDRRWSNRIPTVSHGGNDRRTCPRNYSRTTTSYRNTAARVCRIGRWKPGRGCVHAANRINPATDRHSRDRAVDGRLRRTAVSGPPRCARVERRRHPPRRTRARCFRHNAERRNTTSIALAELPEHASMARLGWPINWPINWPIAWYRDRHRGHTPQGESVMTDLLYYTLTTPDGPFTVIESEDGTVLASGWSDDVASVQQRASLHDDPVLTNQGTPAAEAV